MDPRPLLATLLCSACIVLAAGCGRFAPPQEIRLQAPSVAEEFPPAVLTTTYEGRPMRLTKAYYRALNARAVVPLQIDLDYDAPTRDRGVEAVAGNLIIPASRKPPRIRITYDGHADLYNELHVRMRASAGDYCSVSWHRLWKLRDPLTAPIIPDNEFHTYEIPLTDPYDHTWSGRIGELIFVPSNTPADIRIESIALVFRPQPAPRKVTSAAQTHEALFGVPPAWRFFVPPEAQFEAYVGFPEMNTQRPESLHGAFEVRLERSDSEPVTLLTQVVHAKERRGYMRVSADLAPYEGQEVTLSFGVETFPERLAAITLWGNPAVYSRAPSGLTPVVLISIDTLRADHLSCYGYHRKTTPYLDRLAEESVVFDNAFCQETYTLSSHMTMFTGLYPKHHATTGHHPFGDDRTTITEILQDAGYITAGFTGFHSWFKPDFGFGQGFDIYNTPRGGRRSVFETHDLAISWLNAVDRPGPFLFLHNYDVHGYNGPQGRDTKLPYGPADPTFLHFSKQLKFPESLEIFDPIDPDNLAFFDAVHSGGRSLTPEEIVYINALYDDALLSVDHAINDVFKVLDQRGLYDDALIIVTADHGEALGESKPDGLQLYGHNQVYDNCAKVPLIVKFPHGRFAGTRYAGIVQLVDLFPTILDVLGLAHPDGLDGRSLLALLEERQEPAPFAYTRRQEWQSVRNNTWKLIRDTNDESFELFNIPADPGETTDRYRTRPEALPSLERELFRFYGADEAGWHFFWRREPDDVTDTKLRITCAQPFADVSMLRGDRLMWLNFDPEQIYVERTPRSLGVGVGRLPDEQIHILTSPQANLQIRLRSSSPVLLVIGEGEPRKVTNWQEILSPAVAAVDAPGPAALNEGRASVLVIQYKEPSETREDGSLLTEQEIEELEALGYVL